MNDFPAEGLFGAPIVIALVEMTKRVVPESPERLFPVYSLVWALSLNLGLAFYQHDPLLPAALAGLVTALAASGLYSGGRAVTGV